MMIKDTTAGMESLLSELRLANVRLSLEGDSLKVRFPKGALAPELADRIRENKESLLHYLRHPENSSPKPIPRADPAPFYPLSSQQLRLWITYGLNPDSVAYNIPCRFRIEGAPNLEYYEQAIGAVVQRHEILRTVFRLVDGTPVQIVMPLNRNDLAIDYIDLRTDVAGEAAAEKEMDIDSRKPFVLSELPLFRLKLFHIADEAYILYVNMHHIISDGWSMNVLANDLLTCFNAYAAGADPQLAPLRIQYKDFAVWQQGLLETEEAHRCRAYWQEQLGGELPVLSLPTYNARPPMMSGNGHRISTLIKPALVQQLNDFSISHQGTLFMGLVTVFKSLLYRYTGQEDIVIGSPVAVRHYAGLADQIGYYINTLALRTRFSGSDSFAGVFHKVREVVLSAHAYQMYPFDKVGGDLAFRRDRSRSPIFDMCLVLQNQNDKNRVNSDAIAGDDEITDEGPCLVKFDLIVTFCEGLKGLIMDVEFNTDVYDRATMAAFIGHFRKLLESAMAEPQTAIHRYDHLQASERKMLLEDFNATWVNFPQCSVLDLFKQQVMQRADHDAVIFEGLVLSYKMLDEKSNQLARYLQKAGVRPGMLIPVCLARSLEMMVSIFGVIKAGAAYVPMDPAYPAGRIQYMVNDVRAEFIITQTEYTGFFEGQGQPFIVCVDRDGPTVELESSDEVTVAIHPNSLVYIIYTSGSTGRPKGCMISHRNLSNYIQWANQYYFDNPEGGNWGLLTPVAFDLTVTCIFCSLTRGKTLFIASDAAEMTDLLRECFCNPEIDTLKLTPSHLSLLKDVHVPETAMRRIICGGEQLTRQQVENVFAIDRNIRLFNEYGPTETTVGCIVKEVLEKDEKILIGRPVGNTRVYILGEDRTVAPIGVTGELYIAGAGVGQGYLGEPEITDQRFLPDLAWEGERMYKTGDLGRWMPDGNIEYIGRWDNQVKIRGFRIELGEIEHNLSVLPGIESCVVIVRKRESGEKYLAAYFTSDEQPDKQALKHELSKVLPEYMVPGAFMQLETFPRMPNLKIDRKALPDPGAGRTVEYVAPVTPVQVRLARLIASILGQDSASISLTDNFFEMGMDSMSLIKLNESINLEFGTQLKISALFAEPTIELLAAAYFNDMETSLVTADGVAGHSGDIDDMLNLFEESIP